MVNRPDALPARRTPWPGGVTRGLPREPVSAPRLCSEGPAATALGVGMRPTNRGAELKAIPMISGVLLPVASARDSRPDAVVLGYRRSNSVQGCSLGRGLEHLSISSLSRPHSVPWDLSDVTVCADRIARPGTRRGHDCDRAVRRGCHVSRFNPPRRAKRWWLAVVPTILTDYCPSCALITSSTWRLTASRLNEAGACIGG